MAGGLTAEKIEKLQEEHTADYVTANQMNRTGIDLDSISNPIQRQNTADYLLVHKRNRVAPIGGKNAIAGTASERD